MEEKAQPCSGEGEYARSSALGAFKGGSFREGPREDLNGIFISFLGGSFLGNSLHSLVRTRAGGH